MSPKIFVLCVVLVCAFAAPPTDVVPLEKQQPTVIPIVAQSEELEANGTYKYSYETANGIKREEISYDKVLPSARSSGSSNEGGEEKSDESNEIHVQQGSYSYTAPDGTVISVRYIADENGFRPIGDHLPKPPSILVAASPSRVSGRTPKNEDSDVGSSAPVAAIAAQSKVPASAAPAASLSQSADADTKVPTIELRMTDTSIGQTSTSASEEPSTTLETQSTTVPSRAEPSTTESSTTTEQSLTEGISTTSDPALTTSSEQSTTTESSSTAASEQSTTDVALTPISELSTTEQASTSDGTSTLPASTPDTTIVESTFSSEASTEASTTASQ